MLTWDDIREARRLAGSTPETGVRSNREFLEHLKVIRNEREAITAADELIEEEHAAALEAAVDAIGGF